jgi:hypothetical protein
MSKEITDKQQGNSRETRLARLKPYQFKPGQSGNPKGRPRHLTLSEAYRQALNKPVPNDPENRTFVQKIGDLMILRAASGDTAAAREIADRVEGKARQAIDVDMKVYDWREIARANGLSEEDVINEAKQLLIESSVNGSDEESD